MIGSARPKMGGGIFGRAEAGLAVTLSSEEGAKAFLAKSLICRTSLEIQKERLKVFAYPIVYEDAML